MLFGPDGIGLSVYRYNIGGGGTGVNNRSAPAETFLVSPACTSGARSGRAPFLDVAAERSVPDPDRLRQQCASASGRQPGDPAAARSHQEQRLASHSTSSMWSRTSATSRDPLSYLSPMNEPDYRFEGCGQEGMSVPPEQRAALVQAVGRELAARSRVPVDRRRIEPYW